MGEFGWAYISGSAPLQSTAGVSGSIQYATPDSRLAGSSKLRFKGQNDTLELTGTLKVVGAITASSYHIESITNLNAAGSTSFGNTTDDTHIFTGSMHSLGPVAVTGSVVATELYGNLIGDGSQITNLPPATAITHADSGANRLVTSTGPSIKGNSDLTWDAATLTVGGAIDASTNVTATKFIGDGSELTSLNASEISTGTLNNARLPSAVSVTTLAGAGSGITDINASNINAGTLNNAQLPGAVSVTTVEGATSVSGSAIQGKTAQFSRDVTVHGTLTATNLNITTTGDTIFGDHKDDEHQFTGSVHIAGPLTGSATITATKFIGDGSEITNLPPYGSPAIAYFNDAAQYRLVTAVNSNTVQGESDLTWQAAALKITGSAFASAVISGSSLYGGGFSAQNGRVGIGTTSPDSTLHIHSDSTGNGTVTISQADDTGDASQLDLSKARGTAASPTTVGSTDFIGQIRMLGYDGNSYDNFADIYTQAAGSITTTSHPTKLVIRTTKASATSPTTAVTIDENQNLTVVGKVGVGTTSPAQTLHVNTPNDGEGIKAENSSTGAAFEAKYIAGVGYGYQLKMDDNNNDTTIFLRSYGNSYLNTGGNLGIGTTSPETLLHLKSTLASKPILKIENQQGGANPVSMQMVRDTSTPADDDAIGQIDFRSKNDADAEKLYAYIIGKSTDVTSTNEDGEIQLFTMQGGALVPAMTLQSGKVGIGTQDPTQKLSIDTGNIQLTNGYQLQWGDADTAIFGNATTDYVRIKTAGLDRFSVDSSGKVGIGEINPDTALHVVGSNGLTLEETAGTGRKLIIEPPTAATVATIRTDDTGAGLLIKSYNAGNQIFLKDNGNVGVGTTNPDHDLAVVGDISASVNISASAFYGDGSNLSNVGGTLTVKEEGVDLTTEATSINFIGAYVTASNSGTDVTVTVNAGAGGTGIGAAEDGSYADGLFSGFTPGTTIGTAVDKFNEVLKILAPSPAPNLEHIGVTTGNGATAKLSFGTSNAVGGVSSHGAGAGWSAVDRNGTYTPATDGFKRKLGVYQNSDITGILNYDIAASITNGYYAYRADSFGNGETGTLKLEVNGAVVHSINLATFTGAGTPPNGTDDTGVNGNGSGFLDVSTATDTLDGNGANWGSIFKFRSAKYMIKAADQRAGWNYLRVIHTVGSTDSASNYIEWINDTDASELEVFIPRIEDISLIGSKYLSGVKYNTDATANYKANLNNMYRNVYPDSGTPISFTATNSANPSSVAVAALGGGEDNTKIIELTASLDCNTNSLLNGSIGCNLSATHPIKSNIAATGSATAGGFLIDNRTLSSDFDTENFHDETYRKVSASYDTQESVTAVASYWNSQTHMLSAAGHDDGLIMYNQALRSPKQGANSGNFSALTNGPGGNPDYSSVSGVRTFYRVLTASTGQAYDVRVITTETGTTFNNSALGTGNMHMFVKVPGATGWMDATQDFVYGQIGDYAGALNPTANNSANTRYLTFGTASAANNEHIMFKFVADASWTGNISTIEFDPNINTATNAAALASIDIDNTGTNARLSFGTSNAVAGYQPVTGSGIGSMSTVNSNGAYTASGNRRAVFNSFPTVTGDINGNGGEFRNAYEGNLILEVNGIEVHSVNLHTLTSIPVGAGYDANSNGSGFDLSTLAFRQGGQNANNYNFPYRTGTYKVATADQRLGWNTVRVIHRHGGDTTTTYAQWVVDTDSNALASSSVDLPNFSHDELYYQSGVGYFAQQPSASFVMAVSNVYRNVYWNGSSGITFPTATRCTVTNTRAAGLGVTTLDEAGNTKSLPALNNSANCEQQILNITGNVRYNTTDSIVDGLSLFSAQNVLINCLVKHPLKANLQTKTYTKDNFMYHSGSLAGTTNLNTREDFQLETYRRASNAFANQASVTDSAQNWVSSYSVNDATYSNHEDGLVTIKGYLISPTKIGNAGDTRNIAQGGTLQAPAGNPNYSSGGLTNATRTYYRYFRNETGVASATPTITLYGDANLVAKSGAFYTGSPGANKNINVEIKVPSDPAFTGLDDASTAWADCVKPYSAGVQPTSDGVGVYNGGGASLNQTVGGSGRAIALQLQQSMIRDDQYIVVKITAHKDWTGYLSRIDISY